MHAEFPSRKSRAETRLVLTPGRIGSATPSARCSLIRPIMMIVCRVARGLSSVYLLLGMRLHRQLIADCCQLRRARDLDVQMGQ